MKYFTRLQESPSLATLVMLESNPRAKVEVVPLEDRYGRTVAVRTLGAARGDDVDAVYVCAGDNPVFIANVIALAHAHNRSLDADMTADWSDGI